MRSRWPFLVVVSALVMLCLVVAWSTKSAPRRGLAFDAGRGRAAIERFFTEVRAGSLPRFDWHAMLDPSQLPAGSEEQRQAWESHLTTVEPRLRALDALLGDPDVHELLLTGDGAPVLEPGMKFLEWDCLQNELVHSAELALERGDVNAAMRRVAQAFEIVLTDRDHDWRHTFPASSICCVDPQRLETLRTHARWDPLRAFGAIAPRLRAILEDQERYLGGDSALERRLEGTWLAIGHEEQTVEGVLLSLETCESIVEQSVAAKRVLLLALAADAFRAEHGCWPASTGDLAAMISDDELRTPLAPEPLDVVPDGANLRVGLVHSKRPVNERWSALTLTR